MYFARVYIHTYLNLSAQFIVDCRLKHTLTKRVLFEAPVVLDDPEETPDITNGTLVILKIAEWGGRPSTSKISQQLPVHRVIISHTATEMCRSLDTCKDRVRSAQRYHMQNLNWSQVGYNFLIGGDGRVYVGRDWDTVGAHTKNYNTGSIGISFIGFFQTEKPTDVQVTACHLLLDHGVRHQKLAPDYRIYGHRQFVATDSPGDALYNIITTWPHWSNQK